jgi:hypothetical protein
VGHLLAHGRCSSWLRAWAIQPLPDHLHLSSSHAIVVYP